MAERILFLDIDGPMIPMRVYGMEGQTKPTVTVFDPAAVAIINEACEKQNRKIVLHTSWIMNHLDVPSILGQDIKEHCISQGIKAKHFHEDAYCDRNVHWRYDRIATWLLIHNNVTDYVILDDTEFTKGEIIYPSSMKKHLILVDFDNGLSWKNRCQLVDGNWENPNE